VHHRDQICSSTLSCLSSEGIIQLCTAYFSTTSNQKRLQPHQRFTWHSAAHLHDTKNDVLTVAFKTAFCMAFHPVLLHEIPFRVCIVLYMVFFAHLKGSSLTALGCFACILFGILDGVRHCTCIHRALKQNNPSQSLGKINSEWELRGRLPALSAWLMRNELSVGFSLAWRISQCLFSF
jgi:hypothetical protein